MADYLFFHAARGDFLRRLERWDEAIAAYGRALELTTNAPERAFLEGRAGRDPPARDRRLTGSLRPRPTRRSS